MKPTNSFAALLRHFLRIEFSTRERIITPLFFAAVILLLFAFTLPEPPPEWRIRMVVTECLISAFFALQIALSRAFDAESNDRVFDMIRMSPVSGQAFISAKFCHVALMGAVTLGLTGVIAMTLQGYTLEPSAQPVVLLTGLLMLIGLSALGVLLAAITLRAQARQILFPLLYFPLSTPVLIASSEALCRYLEKPQWDETTRGWLILLAAFDTIYLTLALLMGAEAVSTD